MITTERLPGPPIIDAAVPASLTNDEKQDLSRCESTIARGMRTFEEVGRALLEIRDRRLYRATFPTFAAYCDERWNMSRSRAYRLIDASEVAANLLPIGDILPMNEAQIRPMVGLDPDQQRQVWQQAVESSDGKPTARDVEQAVKAQQVPPADLAAWQRRADAIDLDLTMDAHGRFDVMSRSSGAGLRGFKNWPDVIDHLTKMERATARRDAAAEQAKPNIPELTPAAAEPPLSMHIPNDIRAAADRLGLLIEAHSDQLFFYWPEESLWDAAPMDLSRAREWLRDDAPRLALERLDATLPKELERAGYFWKAADPPTIANNDGWTSQHMTVDGALEFARARLVASKRTASPAWMHAAPELQRIDRAFVDRDQAAALSAAIDLVRVVGGPDPRGVAIHGLKLIEQVYAKLPRTELQVDLSMVISDLNECAEGTEWAHWVSVGWALLDLEASE